jgi:hypothetical protein
MADSPSSAENATVSNGLTDRFLRTWREPRAATRDEIASGSESRLVFYAFAGSVLFSMAAVAAKTLNPTEIIAQARETWVITQIVVGTFFRPLALYGVAAVIGLLCRSAGGTGSYYATRTAVFWTGLVAAPAGVLLTVIGATATGLLGAPAKIGLLGETLGSVVWAALLAPALAEAHGFRTTRGIWLGFVLVLLVAWFLSGLGPA